MDGAGPELLAIAKRACIAGGNAILACTDRRTFGSASGYSTKADIASNMAIIASLREATPEMRIISEEGGDPSPGDGEFWIVDPLDGTWIFHHGGARWSVSIAAWGPEGPLCGVVHAPVLRETFEFEMGMDEPLLNGGRIAPSPSKFPGEWLVSAGAPSGYGGKADLYLENIKRPIPTDDPKRPLKINSVLFGRGSMALELCYLASGRIDGSLRFGQRSWDVAGGMVVALGAGCAMETIDGSPLSSAISGPKVLDRIDLIAAPNECSLSALRGIASGSIAEWSGQKRI